MNTISPTSETASFPAIGERLSQLDRLLTSREIHSAFAVPEESSLPSSDSAPPQRCFSLMDLVRASGENGASKWTDIQTLIHDLRICSQAPNAPILAIMGLLNAGKSSLVATYLSRKGRERILIGSGNKQGTHRFVLWLPVQWKDSPSVWKYLESRLQTIFPAGYEYLADAPEQAAAQYNDTSFRIPHGSHAEQAVSMLEVPLIAFDPGLDALKIALMDCPDVQTGWLPFQDGETPRREVLRDPLALEVEAIADKRLDTLSRVAPICSAFVVVLPANGMHDQKVGQLMQVLRVRMPHSQQLIAINRVPRKYMPEQIHQEVCELYSDRLLQRIYMAYGFEGPNLLERLPEPPEYYVPPEEGTKLPLFFRLDRDPNRSLASSPDASPSGRSWLLGIGQELDSQGLMVDVVRSQTTTLATQVRDAMSRVQKMVSSQNRKREAMQEQLIEACVDFSREPGTSNRVRLQASNQIVEQISQSLERTAPWWAMPGRWTSRLATYGKQQVGQWVKLPGWVTGKAEELMRQIRNRWGSQGGASVVTADALLRALERGDAAGVWGLDSQGQSGAWSSGQVNNLTGTNSSREILREHIQHGIDRFQSESRTLLDPKSLDSATKRMWDQMPWSKRIATGLAPAAVLFAPLAAVILIPFDFGGSSVLVFASLKELLGAGVAGIGIAMLSPDRMPSIAESEAAWQQLGDLVAVMCDEFDLERPTHEHPRTVSLGSESRNIALSNIQRKRSPASGPGSSPSDPEQQAVLVDSSAFHSLVPPAVRIRPGAIPQIESILANLN